MALAALAVAGGGCGEEKSAPDAVAENLPTSTVEAPKGKTSSESVATDDGPGESNVGARRDRDRLLGVFTGMQRDFRAGRMKAVCRHVSQSFLSQFPPGDDAWSGPCEARLARYARLRERRGAKPPTPILVWVRIYDSLDTGGITVKDSPDDPLDERTRIPFTRRDGVWMLDLGVFSRPDMLDAKLRLTP